MTIIDMEGCKNESGGVGTILNKGQSIASSTESVNQDICRICHWEGDGTGDNALVAPCYCSGSLRWVHQHCLQQWIRSSDITCCELCKYQFVMNTKVKSFSQWELLQMSGVEKRKLIMSVVFHWIALICVMWSLYVLVERTAEELQRGDLEWPFWSKLIVVAFGFFGGLVFVYIQCKAYVNLCRRWRSFNRVIYIQNAPEKPELSHITAPAKSSHNATVVQEALVIQGESIDINNCTDEPSSTITIFDDSVKNNDEQSCSAIVSNTQTPNQSSSTDSISKQNKMFDIRIKHGRGETKNNNHRRHSTQTDTSSSENEETLYLL